MTRAILIHLAIALPLSWLIAGFLLVATSQDAWAGLNFLMKLPGHVLDPRTNRYLACFAIPFLALPVAMALWLAPEAGRPGAPRFGWTAARAILCGLVATGLFYIAVQFALGTANRLPGPAARFTLSVAWMPVLLWALVSAAITCAAHAITTALRAREVR